MTIYYEEDLPIKAAFQGHYEVLSRIGSGGFGTVYKARQLATGQLVAVKVLRLAGRGGTAAARRIARFQREMRLCARLHHTNIVGLIDSGQMDDGQMYLVFEFVPGRNLREVLDEEGALDPREARHLLLQVLDALACAHAQGIIHRDLKPSNIMVLPTGARRNALVLDFGIGAAVEGLGGERDESLTGDDEMVGTPAYAAPEQLRGMTATPRADLFSWGLVFSECVAGRPVFPGHRVAEVIAQQLSPEPVRLPAALRSHPVGRLLSRVLVKDVEAREVTAEGLLRELEACDMSDLPRRLSAGAEPDARAAARREPAPERDGGASAREVSRDRPLSGLDAAGERRLLTAVCCFLQARSPGSTGAGVEDRDELLHLAQEICVEVAGRFQGTVAGVLGEQVLLHFGYPLAGEDDAGRAARCALEIAARIRERSARAEAESRLALEVRIGVHTGLVTTPELGGAGARSVVGTTASVAAHLSAQAPPGAVVISGDTYPLLRARFATRALGAWKLGLCDLPVEVHRVEAERPAASSSELDLAAPMAGRSHELALLKQRWSLAREGFGQSALVTGEAGIGKSRLALELHRALQAEAHSWVECRCAPEHQNSALRPVCEALEQMLDLGGGEAADEKAGKLRALLADHGFDVGATMPLFAALLSLPPAGGSAPRDVSPQRRKELTLDAIVSLWIEVAERKPTLLLVEDLQWADPTTLELIPLLLHGASSARLCVLLTARPEFAPPWPLSDTLKIQLGHLESREVRDMIAGITRGKQLPGEVIERVLDQTDGVPLFVEELTRAVMESGALVDRGDRYTLASGPSDLSIPTTLRGSLTARLDRLGRAKKTAQIAAALGREFSAEVLAAVNPRAAPEVEEDLRRLVAADLVLLRRRARQSTYVFKHALVRDAAYESMARSARRELHARIARTLEERFPRIAAEQPGLLALHFAAAEQKREALRYARAAAQGVLLRSLNAEAIAYARQAISWLDTLEDPRERAEVELDLNGMLVPALMATRGGGCDEIEATVQRSQQLISSVGDASHVLATMWGLLGYHTERGHAEQALALAERYLALSERLRDVQHTIAAHVALGTQLFIGGRFAEAQAAVERAISLYDPERHRQTALVFGQDLGVQARMKLGLILWCRGFLEQAMSQVESALALAEELRHTNSIGYALLYKAILHHCWKDRDAVRSTARKAVALAEENRSPLLLAASGILLAWADRDVEGGERHLANMAEGTGWATAYWTSTIAESEAALGRVDEALARLDYCLRAANENRERYYCAELHQFKGDCFFRRGDEPAAERSFREALALSARLGVPVVTLRASLRLAELLRLQGRDDDARDVLGAAPSGLPERFRRSELAAAQALCAEAASRRTAA
ncbi:TOMM system kinase/cyclase fusion protein [Sorangium sp. So ce131]|uniref:TOMM system kinase/cyclase fusion protein n=1 Tax=Sorangium sp. So ce131 TaxID=3133282 RepID=UPI003F5F5A56